EAARRQGGKGDAECGWVPVPYSLRLRRLAASLVLAVVSGACQSSRGRSCQWRPDRQRSSCRSFRPASLRSGGASKPRCSCQPSASRFDRRGTQRVTQSVAPESPPVVGASSPLEVAWVALKLGLTSFGGPIAHLGYFREEYVLKRRWLDGHTFAHLVALCQFLPGPASRQVGLRVCTVRAGPAGRAA